VSPYIDQGTVLRPPGVVPYDHTSVIATLRKRWPELGGPLTDRDAAAPDLGNALTLARPDNLGPEHIDALPFTPTPAEVAFAQAMPLNGMQHALLNLAANLPNTTRADFIGAVTRHLEHLKITGPLPIPAEQLLDKYVQAAGGAAAIDKVTSRVMKGTIDFGGMSLPIEIYAKDPLKRISFTHMAEGDNVTAFDGREGWLGMSGHALREMHGSDLDGAAIDADLHLSSHLKHMFSESRTEGTEKIGDHDAYVVVGQREGKPPIRLYFDKESGLLVRLVRFGETALGWLPTQIDYADYHDVDGVKVPYRWTLARPSGRFTIQVNELKQNVAVDDGKFAKPPAAPEAPKSTAK